MRRSNCRFETSSRLGWLLAGFMALAALVLARIVSLEVFYGEAYRRQAAKPIMRSAPLLAMRGRILARDGTVLAYDRQVASLAVHYRYLEEPPDPRWLDRTARGRVPRSQRTAANIAAERETVLGERAQLHRRLAELCGLPLSEFHARTANIQSRVRRTIQQVREIRRARAASGSESDFDDAPPDGRGWWDRLARQFNEDRASQTAEENFVLAEEEQYHQVHRDLSLPAVAEIEGQPERYAGARVERAPSRVYPRGRLAANLLGYVAAASVEADPGNADHGGDGRRINVGLSERVVGIQGIERRYEQVLGGVAGELTEWTDHGGRVVRRKTRRAAVPGRDVILSLDPALQAAAERTLDQALARRLPRIDGTAEQGGGAVLALDVRTGAILCAASAPRFDPGIFARGDSQAIEAALTGRDQPLFDRASRMALPPGSVFKTLSAIALLESGTIDADRAFYCQGYLSTPDRQRCELFRRTGSGHGAIDLSRALAESCNVYFFHFARDLGAGPLSDWARRFGFGRPTGVDLPDEAAGRMSPRVANGRMADDEVEAWAIGQGQLTATPLQLARLMAAVANGGRLVGPRLAAGRREASLAPRIEGLSPATLAAVRKGLERVVADPLGTGYRTLRSQAASVAGKTGTAETDGEADHALFAGYAPAESPRVAFAVVLEHAGGGGDAAGPVARRLVETLASLGYLNEPRPARPDAVLPRSSE
jgi:penicillin-binding protein 2